MSEVQLAPRQRYARGTFAWADLGTPDPEGAKRFYTALLGWTVQEVPMGGGEVYSMLRHEGTDVAAIYRMRPVGGAPPAWLAYAAVDEVDEAVMRAWDLGGRVLAEPFDVPEAGRMATVQDPTGAVVALWEARGHAGAGALGRRGGMCWVELRTRDTRAARAFYTRLFGWEARAVESQGEPYTVFTRGGERRAGGMAAVRPERETAPHWRVHFRVEDCEAAAARAAALGGAVLMPPESVPGMGRFALLRDPQGAEFAVVAASHPA